MRMNLTHLALPLLPLMNAMMPCRSYLCPHLVFLTGSSISLPGKQRKKDGHEMLELRSQVDQCTHAHFATRAQNFVSKNDKAGVCPSPPLRLHHQLTRVEIILGVALKITWFLTFLTSIRDPLQRCAETDRNCLRELTCDGTLGDDV